MLIHGGIRVTFLTLIVGAPPRPPPPPTAGCRAAEPATPTRMDASAMGGRLRFQHGGQAPPPHRAGRHVRRGRGRKRGARGGRGGRGTPEISSRDRSKPFVQPIKTRESGAPAVQGVLYRIQWVHVYGHRARCGRAFGRRPGCPICTNATCQAPVYACMQCAPRAAAFLSTAFIAPAPCARLLRLWGTALWPCIRDMILHA
jgi:hypothetical protein